MKKKEKPWAKTEIVNDRLSFTAYHSGVTPYTGRMSDNGKGGAYGTLTISWRVFNRIAKAKASLAKTTR